MGESVKYYLAPMEGLTTYIFRKNWHQFYGGMDKYFTPFICNEHMSSRERNDILPEHNLGLCVIPQILTNKADEFLSLSKEMEELGYKEINLNLGCPSGTVTARKRGAGFLSVPDELEIFLDKIFEKCTVDISIKTRIGVESIDEWENILQIYKKFPVKELIIHPRLQKEKYMGNTHPEAFIQALDIMECPLCYNGDIVSPESMQTLMDKIPQVDRVMIGRGILKDPNLLNKIKKLESCDKEVSAGNSVDTMMSFHDAILADYSSIMSGDTNILYKMKDLWAFLGNSFENPEKYIKKIRKSKKLQDYNIAVRSLVRNCRLI